MPGALWAQTIALACKGRVCAKLNQHTEALDAFQRAIAVSNQSFRMVQALALRELANYEYTGADAEIAAAVAQAKIDLDRKLDEFEVRIAADEFEQLSIGL